MSNFYITWLKNPQGEIRVYGGSKKDIVKLWSKDNPRGYIGSSLAMQPRGNRNLGVEHLKAGWSHIGTYQVYGFKKESDLIKFLWAQYGFAPEAAEIAVKYGQRQPAGKGICINVQSNFECASAAYSKLVKKSKEENSQLYQNLVQKAAYAREVNARKRALYGYTEKQLLTMSNQAKRLNSIRKEKGLTESQLVRVREIGANAREKMHLSSPLYRLTSPKGKVFVNRLKELSIESGVAWTSLRGLVCGGRTLPRTISRGVYKGWSIDLVIV